MTECKHHWMIDSPAGQVSVGRCKCGATKEFLNSLPNQRTPKGTCSMSQNRQGKYVIPRKQREKLERRPRVRYDLHESGSSFDDAVRIVEGG